jgi:hypothetical protein
MKTKFYVDDYGKSPEGYDSLGEAVSAMEGRFFVMPDFIRYNLPLRDKARELSVDSFIDWLVGEIPELRDDERTINAVRESLENRPIGDLDCRYVPRDQPFEVCGVEVPSLKALKAARCWNVDMDFFPNRPSHFDALNPKEVIPGLYVAEAAKLYPCFDSEDSLYENRFFRNYLISSKPFTEEQLLEFCKWRTCFNYNKVSEILPQSLLPMAYYHGDDHSDNFFILATPRKKC